MEFRFTGPAHLLFSRPAEHPSWEVKALGILKQIVNLPTMKSRPTGASPYLQIVQRSLH